MHQPPLQILTHSIKYLLQKVICFLELIPKEEVSLTEFEFFEVVLAHNGYTEHISGRKKPTAAGRPLMGDRPALKRDLDLEILGV